MAKKDQINETDDTETTVSETTTAEKPAKKAPDLTGLVKMQKGDSSIHAHPLVVDEHKKNGWKLA